MRYQQPSWHCTVWWAAVVCASTWLSSACFKFIFGLLISAGALMGKAAPALGGMGGYTRAHLVLRDFTDLGGRLAHTQKTHTRTGLSYFFSCEIGRNPVTPRRWSVVIRCASASRTIAADARICDMRPSLAMARGK
jgi:hypothetical protein